MGVQGNVSAWSCVVRGPGGDVQEHRLLEELQCLIAEHGEDGNTGLFNSSLEVSPPMQKESKTTRNEVVNKDPCCKQHVRSHSQPVTMETLY